MRSAPPRFAGRSVLPGRSRLHGSSRRWCTTSPFERRGGDRRHAATRSTSALITSTPRRRTGLSPTNRSSGARSRADAIAWPSRRRSASSVEDHALRLRARRKPGARPRVLRRVRRAWHRGHRPLLPAPASTRRTPVEDTWGAMAGALSQAGKVAALGISQATVDDLSAPAAHRTRSRAVQSELSLWTRDHLGRRSVVQRARRGVRGDFAARPGLLAARSCGRAFGSDDFASTSAGFVPRRCRRQPEDRRGRARVAARRRRRREIALAWVLARRHCRGHSRHAEDQRVQQRCLRELDRRRPSWKRSHDPLVRRPARSERPLACRPSLRGRPGQRPR